MKPDRDDADLISRRTRRHMLRMGGIFASVVLAKTAAMACAPKLNQCPTPTCFLKGTKIETADGERKVEDLAIGDLLPTMFGGVRPVQWIGRARFKKSDSSKPWAESARPIRIARSALAPNVPHADLYMTAGHSLLIDGVLAPVELLINGTTITRVEPEGDELELFHIKLEGHDVIYAEGAPAETLLHISESFANFADYLRRYGMPSREETSCVPVIPIHGGRVELMSRARSALSPWIDLRDQADVVRDRLEEQGIDLSRLSQPV